MKIQDNPGPQALKSDILRLRKEAEGMPNVIRFLDILYCQVENTKKKERLQEIAREVKKVEGEYFL
jgi:hypothetical protein